MSKTHTSHGFFEEVTFGLIIRVYVHIMWLWNCHGSLRSNYLLVECKNKLGNTLADNGDGGLRVLSGLAREDGAIGNEQVVGTVDLGVGVNNRSTVVTTIIVAHLAAAQPVVDIKVGGRLDVIQRRNVSSRRENLKARDFLEDVSHVIETLGDGDLVGLVLHNVNTGRDVHLQVGGNGGSATGGLTDGDVLSKNHVVLSIVVDVEGSINTSSPLQTLETVGAVQQLPDHGVQVGSGLSKHAGTSIEVRVDVALVGVVPETSEVVVNDIRVRDDDISL